MIAPRLALAAAATAAALSTHAAPASEADLLKEAKVPKEFDLTLFAAPPMINYPVFVAAAPDGTLFVSSDGNGSLGRDLHRGRVLRVRDTNGDGKADEVKEFVKDVDAPRGLVCDGNRLFLIHPPHLSVYIDDNGDGVSDREIVLVKNCGFTFKDRPADHTTNGLELGPDGWLYVTQGDFGFMDAEGTDGRRLQFRGGGIWRVRPDGTGLELYAYGTRNCVEAGVSPLLDLFTRDNTNDGGGWDVRFHHLVALGHSGYPMLYKNFADELLAPMADYGGGSGCGGMYVDEPGLPAGYSPAMYTCDWGRAIVYRHVLTPKGATFTPTQDEFIKITRSTDVDIDGMSAIYAASWRGAVFNWAGPDVGFIVRVTPKGYTPEPLPDFAKLADLDLVRQLLSPSHRRRLAAQRTLLSRGLKPEAAKLCEALAADATKPLAARVIAIFTLKQGLGANATPAVVRLAEKSDIQAWAVRALADRLEQNQNVPDAPVLAALKSSDARTRREAVNAAARLNRPALAAAVAPLVADPDPVVAHVATRALQKMTGAAAPLLAILDRADAAKELRAGALRAIRLIHEKEVVDALLARLDKEQDAARRKDLVVALCRLSRVEGVWKGDSWGTRPDTRGPYYQPEKWAESDRIEAALATYAKAATGDELSAALTEFARHRIDPGGASGRLLELAAKDEAMIAAAVAQVAESGKTPAEALPVLLKAAANTSLHPVVQAQTAIALARLDKAEAVTGILQTLASLESKKGAGDQRNKARDAFLNAGMLENQVDTLAREAAKLSGDVSAWADAALLKLASRKIGSPEPREHARKVLEDASADPKRRIQILGAAARAHEHYNFALIVAALEDPNPEIAKAAHNAARELKIDPAKFKADKNAPQIASMKVEDVVTAIATAKGDVSRGQQLFTQQGCIACHTVAQGEALKGPYLGNIRNVYGRRELAEAILLPNKTIAQGFVTHLLTLKNGTQQAGFVTEEAADKVTIRTITSQEVTIPTADIVKREKMDHSIMPEQLVATLTVSDFASLLDYLESLAGK